MSDDERYSWLNIWELPQTPDGVRDLLLRYDATVIALAAERDAGRTELAAAKERADRYERDTAYWRNQFSDVDGEVKHYAGRNNELLVERAALQLALGQALAALHPLKGQLDPYEFGEDVVARVEGMLTTDATEAAQKVWSEYVAMQGVIERIMKLKAEEFAPFVGPLEASGVSRVLAYIRTLPEQAGLAQEALGARNV